LDDVLVESDRVGDIDPTACGCRVIEERAQP
jgi:hypothetical protein